MEYDGNIKYYAIQENRYGTWEFVDFTPWERYYTFSSELKEKYGIKFGCETEDDALQIAKAFRHTDYGSTREFRILQVNATRTTHVVCTFTPRSEG